MPKPTTYSVVDAPRQGRITVLSSHRTAKAAWRAAGKGGTLCVRAGYLRAGDTFFCFSIEQNYPLVSRIVAA